MLLQKYTKTNYFLLFLVALGGYFALFSVFSVILELKRGNIGLVNRAS